MEWVVPVGMLVLFIGIIIALVQVSKESGRDEVRRRRAESEAESARKYAKGMARPLPRTRDRVREFLDRRK